MKQYPLHRLAGGLLAALLCLAPAGALAQQQAAGGVHKQETVYGELHADGSLKGTTVSVYLSNPEGLEKIEDVTNLESLETLAGELPPDVEAGRITWNARGEDVLYQGVSQQALPVSVAIEYELDGKPVEPEALLGQSGHLVMRFTYTNHVKQTVAIGEGQAEIYTPFTVATVVTLPQEHFTSVKTDADRAITQGDATMVMDLAFPGLAESLNRDPAEMGGGTMTLEADVTDFTLQEITFLVTPKLIEESDLSAMENLDELKAGLEETDEGGEALSEGAGSLRDGAYSFARGVDQYAKGVAELAGGLTRLAEGAPQLADGGRKLADGLESIQEQTESMGLTGEDGLLEKLLANQQELDQALEGIVQMVGDAEETIARLDAAIAAMEAAAESMEEAGAPQEQVDALRQQIAQMQALRDQAAGNRDTLNALLDALRDQLGQLEGAPEKLEAMVSGLEELVAGARQLSDGLNALESQVGELKSGAAQLDAGASELSSGAWSLARAAGQLSGALDTFNEEAIDRLAGDTAAEIDDFQARKEALLAASEAYASFTGEPENTECEVSFILRTPLQQAEAIPEPEAEAEAAAQAEQLTGWQRFWQWLTGLFGG